MFWRTTKKEISLRTGAGPIVASRIPASAQLDVGIAFDQVRIGTLFIHDDKELDIVAANAESSAKKRRTTVKTGAELIRQSRALRPSDELLRKVPPVFKASSSEEPRPVFAENGVSVDPKAGLEDCGPFGYVAGKVIKLRLVGTRTGIQAFHDTWEVFTRQARSGIQQAQQTTRPSHLS